MKTITVKAVICLVCLLVLVTFINQIRLFLKTDYKTETAVSISSTEVARITGIYVRDEAIIPRDSRYVGGVLKYVVADGGKVAADSVIAEVYKSRDDIETANSIAKIENEINILLEEQNPGATAIAQPEFISSLINSAYQSVLISGSSDDLTSLAEARTDLRTVMGIYNIVTKAEVNYQPKIEELSRQLSYLQSKLNPPIGSITSGSSGYFISRTDGYENSLRPDDIPALTADRIKYIIENQTANISYADSVGKLVSGYSWKMVGIINPESASFKTDSKVTLKFPENDVSVEVTIEEVLETSNPNERIIVLSCDEFRAEFASKRVVTADLVLNDFTGIRVPRNAIRFNSANEMGVYILQGEKVTFKKIVPLFETPDYIISSSPDNSHITLYDDIITSGVDTAALATGSDTFTAGAETEGTEGAETEGTNGAETVTTETGAETTETNTAETEAETLNLTE
ncbi:MAG: hypothetical protein LBM59_07240 [Ruminococcus sp.]|jgi:hypothetical protein|nr:hypothetical protein [Ruminococcus sp.]